MPQGLSYVHKVHEPAKSVHKKHNSRRYEHPASGVAGPIGVGLCAIHPSSWNSNSRKFGKNNVLNGTKFIGNSSALATVVALYNSVGLITSPSLKEARQIC